MPTRQLKMDILQQHIASILACITTLPRAGMVTPRLGTWAIFVALDSPVEKLGMTTTIACVSTLQTSVTRQYATAIGRNCGKIVWLSHEKRSVEMTRASEL